MESRAESGLDGGFLVIPAIRIGKEDLLLCFVLLLLPGRGGQWRLNCRPISEALMCSLVCHLHVHTPHLGLLAIHVLKPHDAIAGVHASHPGEGVRFVLRLLSALHASLAGRVKKSEVKPAVLH